MSRKQNIVIKGDFPEKREKDGESYFNYRTKTIEFADVAGFQIAEGFFMVISHNGDVEALPSSYINSFTVENIGE